MRTIERARGGWCAAALVWAVSAGAAAQSPPSSASAPAALELPPAVQAALATIEDFALHFDQPGFYAILEQVKHRPHAPGTEQPPLVVTDWRDLLERPGEFRGRAVTIEGRVGRNKAPYKLETRPELGGLWQLEIERPDQPIACTLICTNSVADIPLGATVTATGYFVMIRQFYGASGRLAQAALLVTPGPTAVDRAVPRAASTTNWSWFVAAAVGGALVAWLLLRYAARSTGRTDPRTLHASQEAPLHLAEDLAKWADSQGRDDH
jgi:hypothetical protein